MKVSCLILTYNEASNIEACLTALNWCDDVLVLDSGSTDATVPIARNLGARVLDRQFDDFAGQRNFGLDQGEFRHEWVLHLDADEVVTQEFTAALDRLVAQPGIDAYLVPSKMMLFDRWLKHAGMYPVYQVRLGHRDRLRFKQVGHGQREDLPPHRVGMFNEPYLHYSFSHGMSAWLGKHIRYARDEATLLLDYRDLTSGDSLDGNGASGRRRLLKAAAAHLPVTLRPILRFLYVYIIKQGFRDGRAGFAYAAMLAVYEGMTALFVLEKLLAGSKKPRRSQLEDLKS
jgi:hypothetical protein